MINAGLNIAGFVFAGRILANFANIRKSKSRKNFGWAQFAKINSSKYFVNGDLQEKYRKKFLKLHLR